MQSFDPSDRPIMATADDALLAKKATVQAGYYDDPYLSYFFDNTNAQPLRLVQPIIKRGTHARVACIERALMLSLREDNTQIVILGAGMDTSFLRLTLPQHHQQYHTHWYEVDHPLLMKQKARCVRKGLEKSKIKLESTNDDEDVAFVVWAGDDKDEKSSCCAYIGHDLRLPPSQLIDRLVRHGFRKDAPTLFVMECVQMYLPDVASQVLLREIAHACPNAHMVLYDPIGKHDAFGRVMEQHLMRAGVASPATSLLRTRTLEQQIDKFLSNGWEVAVGCDMWQAYQTILTEEQRRRANQCEFLDELEEWILLMQHYCLVVASTTTMADSGRLATLCQMGPKSPMGFVQGSCLLKESSTE